MKRPEITRIDAVYLVRPQVERWTDEELRRSSLKSARDELERRKQVAKVPQGQECPKCRRWTGELNANGQPRPVQH